MRIGLGTVRRILDLHFLEQGDGGVVGIALPQAAMDHHAFGHLLTDRHDAAAEDGIHWVNALCNELNVPALRAWGVTEADLPGVVEKATGASSMKANPLPLTSEELLAVVMAAR